MRVKHILSKLKKYKFLLKTNTTENPENLVPRSIHGVEQNFSLCSVFNNDGFKII